MTGDEYRELRQEIGLTQLQLANALDIDPSTVARREKSDEIVTEAEIAIRSLRDFKTETAPTGAG